MYGDKGGQSRKPWLYSIRLRTIIIILAMVLPIVFLGVAGTLYYQHVMKQEIYDDYIANVQIISAFTPDYMNSSELYLQSIADRPRVVDAMAVGNRSVLHSTATYGDATNRINSLYFTDSKGIVIESTEPISELIGSNVSNYSYVGSVFRTGKPVIGDAVPGLNQMPVVPIAVPIKNDNETVLGVMVGTVDLNEYSKILKSTASAGQLTYLVNSTGHIMVHSDPDYMRNMTDFSSLPVVQNALSGKTGASEYYNPIHNQSMIGAYAPIDNFGWGVVWAMPQSLAYKPVWDTTWLIATVVAALSLIAIGLGLYFGNSIVDPIAGLSQATEEAFKTSDYRRFLPLDRKDEIGDLARSFGKMVDTVKQETSARERATQELNEAKIQAELYLDLMGHDINNMNQIALGYLELAVDAVKDDGVKELVKKPLDAIQNSSKLIENVRKLQKLKSGGLKTEAIDLDGLLADLRDQYLNVPGKQVTIDYAPCKNCYVMANGLLRDVFSNLIGNAIKHSGSSKPVRIGLGLERVSMDGSDYCKVVVEDDGPGIPDAQKGKVFARFRTENAKAGGRGLGLYLVHSLVDDFHGTVHVEDRVPGNYTKGARFVVMLPAIEK